MALSQNLNIMQGHALVMTPQLQLAIKLLELSNLELSEFIDMEIEKNPLLERVSPVEDYAPDSPQRMSEGSLKLDQPIALSDARDNLDAPDEDAYPADSPSETTSSDGGPSAELDWSGMNASGGRGVGEAAENYTASTITLREHLEEQLHATALAGADRLIARRLIEETDETGYLRADLAALADQLGVPEDEAVRVLTICQQFEPTGVMARDLRECLRLQLLERDRFDPAMAAMIDNLVLVARGEFRKLCETCGVDMEDLSEMLSELRSLSPRPGSDFASDAAPPITPDVFVRELSDGDYAVELNTDTLPRLIIDRTYYAEVSSQSKTSVEKSFISECSHDANWLIKSLDQRAKTILKVSREIVRQQGEFLKEGANALRPLTMKAVADEIGLHESTVSRVTSNKYMSTPRGLFELKYFFSPAIPSSTGGEAWSAEAVRHRIKSMIETESADDVLSDDQIVLMLREHGVDIARRTVAKYRESLRIPSSVDRRRRSACDNLASGRHISAKTAAARSAPLQ